MRGGRQPPGSRRALAGEGLDGLATTARLVLGADPDVTATRAFTHAWSEAVLGYLHGLSCDDPLAGLSSLAHLRTRVSDAYRRPPRRLPG